MMIVGRRRRCYTGNRISRKVVMERILRGVRLALVGFLVVGALMMWAENSEPTMAATAPGRRLGTTTSATLDKMSVERFAEAGLAEKSAGVAVLDNIQVDCTTTGMVSAMVDGVNVKDGVSETERAAMLYNTWILQHTLACAPAHSSVYMPAGTFYFMSGHLVKAPGLWLDDFERHVIRPASFVDLVGKGTDEDGKGTVLKPYSDESEFTNNALAKQIRGNNDGKVEGGLDMFFFNDYAAYKFADASYLEDADFYDFVINSEDTQGVVWRTSGKGFMINLFRDCEWDNMVVKSTDGTGFGVDAPVNGKITNSKAEGCGKDAETDESAGASGFGIGTGYADNESMTIKDSVAINNRKYGFFFEHQGRFNVDDYQAIKAKDAHAFYVVDCRAEGNLYNFGGEWAYDVYYNNLVSVPTDSTRVDVHFSGGSRRIDLGNVTVEGRTFGDVPDGAYYTEAVDWGVTNGVTVGVEKGRFGVGQTVRRGDAVTLLWRLNGYPGEVLSRRNGNVNPAPGSTRGDGHENVQTCFSDVEGNAYYAAAVKWAYEQGITNGTRDCTSVEAKDGLFDPDRGLKRAEFVTMLWRAAGSPSAAVTEKFEDVDENDYYYQAAYWAAANGITNGVGDNRFAPDYDCTREQAITMLYRFAKLKG